MIEDLFQDNLKTSRWLGKVVDINDPNKEGRVRVNVFGKFDSLTNEQIPWARPSTRTSAGSESGSGSHSVPKLNSIVGIIFDNGNIYEPEYYTFQHLSDEAKSEISDSYDNSHILIYDTVTSGGLKVFFTENKGLMLDYQSVQINIKNDKSIFITNPNGDIIELKNDGNHTITLSKDIVVNCQNATINAKVKAKVDSPAIELGHQAVEAVIKGNTFQTLFNAHLHIDSMGLPTSPPSIPLTGSELSTVSKTQ